MTVGLVVDDLLLGNTYAIRADQLDDTRHRVVRELGRGETVNGFPVTRTEQQEEEDHAFDSMEPGDAS